MALRRIKKELRDYQSIPSPNRMPNGCFAEPDGDDYFTWKGLIIGPKNTSYHNGYFYLNIKFPQDYPFKPMKITFDTKIYHPQIHDRGYFCLSNGCLRDNWTPAYTLSLILQFIKEMIMSPDPNWPYKPQIAKIFQTNRELYDQTVSEWVSKFAPPPNQPLVENLTFKYIVKTQCIECNFNINLSKQDINKYPKIKFVAVCDEIQEEVFIESNINKYTFSMRVEIAYGQNISIESSLQYQLISMDSYNILKYSRSYSDVFMDELDNDRYYLLIIGYLRDLRLNRIIPMDVIKICFEFYEYKYYITMIWKTNLSQIIEERTMKLMKSRDITYYKKTRILKSIYIKQKFLQLFELKGDENNDDFWNNMLNSFGEITIDGDSWKDSEYPKTIEIFMNLSKFGCFDVKYKNIKKRMVLTTKLHKNLQFIKKQINNKLDLSIHADKLQIIVGNKCIDDEDDVVQYLFNECRIIQCCWFDD